MEEQANGTVMRRIGLLLALLIGLVAHSPAALSAGEWTTPGQTFTWRRPTVPQGAPASSAETTRTIYVDAIADDDPDGGCTLREAIDLANWGFGWGLHPNGCTSTESGSGAPITYVLNLPAYTYTLSGPVMDDNNWGGDLDVAANVRIIGAGADLTIIDGAEIDRVFHIDPLSASGYTIDFYGLTIRKGRVADEGGGIHSGANNTVNISACTILNNQAIEVWAVGADGGGIYAGGGVLNLTGSTVSGNRTTTGPDTMSRGGGIHAAHTTLTISGSTIQGNSAFATAGLSSRSLGGGLSSLDSTVTISDTAVTGNKATGSPSGEYMGQGGGIYASGGEVSIAAGSTISGNEAQNRGGGIYSFMATTSVHGSSIDGNNAADGGGIFSHGLPLQNASTTGPKPATASSIPVPGAGRPAEWQGSGAPWRAASSGIDASGIQAPLYAVSITDSTIDNNQASDRGGGIYNLNAGKITVDGSTVSDNTAPDGGGIYNRGQLTIQNRSLIGGDGAGNEATDYGGGIHNNGGSLTIYDSAVSGNTCGEDGGGIYDASGVVILHDSEVSGNISDDDGGGVYSSGHSGQDTLIFNKCTISGNTANSSSYVAGGGILLFYSHATIYNTTISGNKATRAHGGGVGTLSDQPRIIDLVHCTITANRAGGNGGGLQLEGSYTTNISSTIVAGNSADGDGPDIEGTVNSQDYNLIQDTTDTTIGGTTTHNITDQDPRLGPLASNGGDTQTHALLEGSPAIDAIPEASCPRPNDQRGVPRPQRSGCDIGAYEADTLHTFLPLVLKRY